MTGYPVPPNESARIAALESYRILDTEPEAAMDDITRLASFICGVPAAFVTLIDRKRQWFKSKAGALACNETPREHAFCAHTILKNELLVVEDARADPRFAGNPMVTGEPFIRFYAGAPLVTPDGHGLGSLGVIDTEPRRLSEGQKETLLSLARMAMSNLELRLTAGKLAEAAASIKTLSGLVPICCYCKGIRNDEGFWQSVEEYIHSNTAIKFTHGVCPACAESERKKMGDSLKR